MTSGTVGSIIVITGTGFDPAATITITTAVGTTTVPWLSQGLCATSGGGISTAYNAYGVTTPVDSLVTANCLTTTASGTFQVEVSVPNLPGGANTITVSDSVNTQTASFTVTPAITMTFTGNNFGFPEETVTPTISVSGFASDESVSVADTVFSTASFSCTTGEAVGNYGTCVANNAAQSVLDTTGGSHVITATGATSGFTATTTYTINPWAAFYNSNAEQTTFSFIGTAPTSLIVEAHGLAAGTIAADSITIGGVTTNHGSITVGSTGAFYAAVISPTANVPYGLASAVIQGNTFSYANGNIAQHVAIGGANVWGGALISSVEGISGSSTGVVTLSGTSFMPGTPAAGPSTTSPAPAQNQVGFFGYGLVSGGNGGGALSIATPSGVTWATAPAFATGNGGGAAHGDANGAFFATALLGDTPWSAAATPTTAATYTPTVAQVANKPANILSPSFGITPWVDTSYGGILVGPTAGTATSGVPFVDYSYFLKASVHGFGPTDTVTITVGATSMVSGGTVAVGANGAGTTAVGQVPDLAGGPQSITATGSVSGATTTAAGAVTYFPTVDSTAGVSALSINQGGAGQTTVVRTGVDYGIHGLAANTAYDIMWNAISGSQLLGTFTSSATGGVPIPGTQVTIPSDSSGIHILDIQSASGVSAIFGSLVAGQITPTESIAPANFPDGVYTSAFGDLLFSNVALLSASPSVASVGAAETISGTGLEAGGSYVVALGNGPTTVALTAPALATFTATSSGAVPANTAITLSDTPTTIETGTVEYFSVQTTAHYGVTTASDASAEFVLASSAKLNMTSASIGHAVILTAHALNPTGVYDIVFNYVQSAFVKTSYTGTTVGVIAPNAVGAGSATFDVPAGAASGSTVVQLVVSTQGAGGSAVGTAVLNTPLSLDVGSVSTTSCSTTSCVAVSGSTFGQQGVYNGITSSFTNNSNQPVTAFAYAVAHNALGQTVDISTATLNSVAAGQSVTAFNVLFGLAPGTYSVTIFVTSSAGTAISSTSTLSVTIP